MVYFVRARGTQYVKIGYVQDSPGVASRLSTLQCGSPFRLVLERIIPGELADEAALHQRFAAYRTIGEWFRLTSKDVHTVCAGHTSPECMDARVGCTLSDEEYLHPSRAFSSEAQKILAETSQKMGMSPSSVLEYLIRHKGLPCVLSDDATRLVDVLAAKCNIDPHDVVELAIRAVACWEGVLQKS
jgi:hypothetical protein